jgi:hypothetical protein
VGNYINQKVITLFMDKLARSSQLVNETFDVLKKDKEILWFPIISILLIFLLVFSFLITFFFTGVDINDYQNLSFLHYFLLFIFYILSYFIVIFFNVAMMTCANIRFKGRNPKFRDGWENARKHLNRIFVWAFISATVGIILRVLANRFKILGKIVISIIGMAWALLTYFVVPILIFENKGVLDSVKRSGLIFKKTWGENFIGNIGIGFRLFFYALIGAIPLIVGYVNSISWLVSIGLVIFVITFLFLIIVRSALNNIFVVALYHYALTRRIPKGFSPDLIRKAFVSKKK